VAQLADQPLPETKSVTSKSRIAYFPQAWADTPNSPDSVLNTSYNDVPEGEPELIHEFLHPWPERSKAGRLVDLIRRMGKQKSTSNAFVTDSAPAALTAENLQVRRD
jgi:hypothetical protein